MQNNLNFMGLVNFLNGELNSLKNIALKIETTTKDYLNKRGKKKGTTYIFSLKDLKKEGNPPRVAAVSVLDVGNVYVNINIQKIPLIGDVDFVNCKYLLFVDVFNFLEENKANFKFTDDSVGQCLEKYIPDNILKLGLEEKKIFYRTKFNKGEKTC